MNCPPLPSQSELIKPFLPTTRKREKLGDEVMPGSVQTTPQLFGWLLFEGILADVDKDNVISEHDSLDRPLAKYFEEISEVALRYQSYL